MGMCPMKIIRYGLINKEKSDYFGEISEVRHSEEVEWFYGEDKIGASTYPFHEPSCFLRHLWTEDDTIVMRKSVGSRDARIKRKLEEGGSMSGIKYGDSNIENLVRFIEDHERIHLFHTHPYAEEPVPHLITFSKLPPSPRLYKIQRVIPVEFEKGYLEGLVKSGKDKLRRIFQLGQ